MSIYNEIQQNKYKTYLIVSLFVLLVSGISYLIGKAELGSGAMGLVLGITISTLSSLGSYFYGDKMVLSLHGAKPADKKRDFDFYTSAENMAIASGIPLPKLYVIETDSINAFATGRDPQHAVVCATRGLLNRLTRSETEGVIAHEMSHVKNYDIRLMLIVTVLVGTVIFVTDFFMRSLWWRGGNREEKGRNSVFMIIAIIASLLTPLFATLIQLAISRRREYLADASGAYLTRNPDALADALEKIKGDNRMLPNASGSTAHLFISNPLKTKALANLFSTHPPIDERIRILRSM